MGEDQFNELLRFMKLYESKFTGCFAEANIGENGWLKVDIISSDTGKSIDEETWLESDGTELFVNYPNGEVESLDKLMNTMGQEIK